MGMMFRVLMGFAVALIVTTEGNAACHVRGSSFSPPRNDSVATSMTITKGSACLVNLSSGGLAFEGITIVDKPKFGAITVTNVATYRYVPRRNYLGTDNFAIRVCASGRAGRGCSTLRYDVSVQ